MALSGQEYECRTHTPSPVATKQLRILGILGESRDIDLEKERAFLQNLPNVETQFLVNPTRPSTQCRTLAARWLGYAVFLLVIVALKEPKEIRGGSILAIASLITA